MATDDIQRLVTGTSPAPAHFKIPGNGQMRPKTIFAHYDGTGAAVPFIPALKILSDSGDTIGIYPTADIVAAGESAEVSFFPGVGGGSGSTPRGLLLGTKAILGPAGAYTLTSTTGLVEVSGGALAGVPFTVPASGVAYVRFDATIHNTGNVNNWLGLVDGFGTPILGPLFGANPGGSVANTADVRVSVSGVINPQPPGSTISIFAAGMLSAGGTMQVNVNPTNAIVYEVYDAVEFP